MFTGCWIFLHFICVCVWLVRVTLKIVWKGTSNFFCYSHYVLTEQLYNNIVPANSLHVT